MANFDTIFDETIEEDDHHSRISEDYTPVTPEHVVIRGVGHMTV